MSIQLDMLATLCEDYGISAEWLLTGNGDMMRRGESVVQNVTGSHCAATANGDAVVESTISDKERISYLEKLLSEKERTIQILLSR